MEENMITEKTSTKDWDWENGQKVYRKVWTVKKPGNNRVEFWDFQKAVDYYDNN